eukprot:g6306.t1
MSDAGGASQTVSKRRYGRQTAIMNLYHPSKYQLIDWVNQILLLGITRLEEVNFHAKEEYEFIPNYKILQGCFTQLNITRNMDVQKLMRGAPSETLEFLQWMYKLLKKHKIVDNYDPVERRKRSYKGGIDRIPLPYWMHSHFDVFGRPDSANHRRTGTHVDPNSSGGRYSRYSRTPGPQIGSGSSGSSLRLSLLPRTSSADGIRHSTDLSSFARPGSRRKTLHHSVEPKMPKDRLRRRTKHSSLTPSIQSVPVASKSDDSTSSMRLRSSGKSSGDFPAAPATPKTGEMASDFTEDAIEAIKQCLMTLKCSVPNFKTLIEDLGTDSDSYAYRGRLRGLKDVISILIRHNNLLVEELGKLQRIPEEDEDDLESENSFCGFPKCIKQISDLEQEFETCVQHLTELETRNPVPQNCSLIMTERQNKLSDTVDIDNTLRSIGAAQANLNQPMLNFGSVAHRCSSPVYNPRLGQVQSISDTQSSSRSVIPGAPEGNEYQIRRMKNGDVYKGKYSHSKKHGDGVYLFSVGDIYEGNFLDDCMTGSGVYTFAAEGRYEGEWRDSLYEGVGTETFARGSTYHGEYMNGLRHGWGTCRYLGGAYYEGEWLHGLREGRGMQQCPDGSNYIGEYLAGKRHGYGAYCFPNGDRFVGQFDRDVPHGHGVYTFTSGQRYEGQWNEGLKHGWCVYIIETGETWAGQWTDGKPSWIQALSIKDGEFKDPSWPEEVLKRVETAWDASIKAKAAEVHGSERADAHWRADGEVQTSIVRVRAKAEKAVTKAQEERKRAVSVAEKLDTLAAEHQARFDS